jgi:hypothetical protein
VFEGVDFSCGTCGRIYKYKSGLSRHRKGCAETNRSLVLKTTTVKVAKASMEGNDAAAINLLAQALSKQGDLIEFSAVIITSSRNVTETRKKVQLSDIFMGSISGFPSEERGLSD